MRTRVVKILVLVALMIGAAAAVLPLLAESREPREVIIVARQMAFYLQDGGGSNPTIRVQPGERLRLTFVNDESGVGHDFTVKAWSAATPVVRGKGRTSITITAPPRAGKAEYACSLHESMMSGTIQVER